jgi:hypothetical protein
LITRIARFLQDVVCFGIGRTALRALSMGRLDARLRDPAAPWVTFLGVLVAFAAIAAVALWVDASTRPRADGNLFHTRSQFQAFVAQLDLAQLPPQAAAGRLSAAGFRCELFSDGNVACLREARGHRCGERQFVDLLVPDKAGAAHTILTRFGRMCR